jgi:hypothetical protein
MLRSVSAGVPVMAIVNPLRGVKSDAAYVASVISQIPGPVLADQVDHRPPGVAEPGARLRVRQPVHEVGAQRLIPPVVYLLR